MSIAVSMEWDGLHSTLERVAAIGLNPDGLLAAIGVALEDSTRARIEEGHDPDGVDWQSYAPLNPLYAADKKGLGILRESGMLQATIESIVFENELLVGSRLPYAPVHQFGAIIHPQEKPKLSFMMGAHLFKLDELHIPRRPYLGLSSEDKANILTILDRELKKYQG